MDKHIDLDEAAGGLPATSGRQRVRRLVSHFGPVVARALLATIVLWLTASFPLPLITSQLFQMLRTPVAILIFIIYIGKLLIDTFFYDHYV